MAPLIEKARQTPTRSVIAWLVLNGRAWLVGVHGLYADEDALPSPGGAGHAGIRGPHAPGVAQRIIRFPWEWKDSKSSVSQRRDERGSRSRL